MQYKGYRSFKKATALFMLVSFIFAAAAPAMAVDPLTDAEITQLRKSGVLKGDGNATGRCGMAWGDYACSSASCATAMGLSTCASGNASVAMGNHTQACGDNSVAMGSFSVATGNNSIALGGKTYGESSVSMNLGSSYGAYSTAMGAATTGTLAKYAVAMGARSNAAGVGALAGGGYAFEGSSGLVYFDGGKAYGKNSFAFGTGAVAGNVDNSGASPVYGGDYAFAFGRKARATQEGAIAFGTVAESIDNKFYGGYVKSVLNDRNVNPALYDHYLGASGYITKAINWGRITEDDLKAMQTTMSDEEVTTKMEYIYSQTSDGKFFQNDILNYNVPELAGATASGENAIAIGNSLSEQGTVASGKNSAVFGNDAKATAENALALGTNANASHANSVALGSNSVTSEDDEISVGSSTHTRKISNVKAVMPASGGTYAATTGQVYNATLKEVTLGSDYKTLTVAENGTSTTVDLSGLKTTQSEENAAAIVEIKDAKTGILAQAKNYTDDLKNGAVKANTDAIAAINNADKGILAQAKAEDAANLQTAKDYSDELIEQEKTARENAVAALDTRITDNKTAIDANAKAIEANTTAIDKNKTDITAVKDSVKDYSAVKEQVSKNTQDIKKGYVGAEYAGNKLTFTKADGSTDYVTIESGSGSGAIAGGTIPDGADVAKANENGTAVASGYNSQANAENSVANGFASAVSKKSAAGIAIGKGATVGYEGGKTDGRDTAAISGIAIGENSIVEGANSIAVGYGHVITGKNSGAFGDPTYIDADNAYAVGNKNNISETAKGSFIMGNESSVTTEDTFVIGSRVTKTAKNSVILGSGSEATEDNVVSVGSADNKRRIVNVADGKYATDAATVGQVDRGFANVQNQLGAVSGEVKEVGAISAALAGLHYVEPSGEEGDKFVGAVAYGNYRGESAGAIGVAYKPSPNFMLSASTSVGQNQNAYNAGASLKFGKGETAQTRAELKKQVQFVNEENKALKAENAVQGQKISTLETEVSELRQTVEELKKLIKK